MRFFKYTIEIKSLFRKGLPKIDDKFGIYFITGKQGSGKSYYAVKLLLAQDPRFVNKVYTNVRSLKVKGYDIVYFDTIDSLYYNIEENCIFIIDEISRKYDRTSRTDTQFYAWLNQSRKRKRIVLLITQEWRELPMWIRRPAKFMFSTRKILFNLFITSVGDAENLVFDKDESEYLCPPLAYTIYKRNKYIADMYDTFESVNDL